MCDAIPILRIQFYEFMLCPINKQGQMRTEPCVCVCVLQIKRNDKIDSVKFQNSTATSKYVDYFTAYIRNNDSELTASCVSHIISLWFVPLTFIAYF